jgi:hypothetical protein
MPELDKKDEEIEQPFLARRTSKARAELEPSLDAFYAILDLRRVFDWHNVQSVSLTFDQVRKLLWPIA